MLPCPPVLRLLLLWALAALIFSVSSGVQVDAPNAETRASGGDFVRWKGPSTLDGDEKAAQQLADSVTSDDSRDGDDPGETEQDLELLLSSGWMLMQGRSPCSKSNPSTPHALCDRTETRSLYRPPRT